MIEKPFGGRGYKLEPLTELDYFFVWKFNWCFSGKMMTFEMIEMILISLWDGRGLLFLVLGSLALCLHWWHIIVCAKLSWCNNFLVGLFVTVFFLWLKYATKQ
uniref:Uncharacterized protein n=1 Tax=Opuntia streptacantha TaxID=393608 RepID=A0A7C8YGD2_OPUST